MTKLQRLIMHSGIIGLTLLMTSLACASSESAAQIMEHAYKVNGGNDLLTRITYTFYTPGDLPRKLAMTMATKNFRGKEGLISKSITFNEFPPNVKDVSFMAWVYHANLDKEDDMWLYLPELRSIRKLTQNHGHTNNNKENKNTDELFSSSELTRNELLPRFYGLDDHKLVKTEDIDGIKTYVIESIPKQLHSTPFSKTLRWITADNYLPTRIEYYDSNNILSKEQTFVWQQINDAWIWEKVEATNKQTGNRTVLEQTDVKVNIGINDSAFSKRMMQLGGATFLSRYAD